MLRIQPQLGATVSPLVYPTSVAAAVPGAQQASTFPTIAKVGLAAALIGVVAVVVGRSKKKSRSAPRARESGGLHDRIAKALGWPLSDVRSMSLHSLRDLVRPVDPALASDISRVIASGGYIL